MLAPALPGQLGHGTMYMLRHAGKNTVESCWQWRCRGDLAMVQSRCRVMLALAPALSGRLGRGTMYMLRHAGENTVESCWQWHCRGDLVVVQSRCRVMLVLVLPSHARDDIVGQLGQGVVGAHKMSISSPACRVKV
jgi:hypothetical protein